MPRKSDVKERKKPGRVQYRISEETRIRILKVSGLVVGVFTVFNRVYLLVGFSGVQ